MRFARRPFTLGCHNALQILFICQYIVTFKADVTNKTDYFIGGFNTFTQDDFMSYFTPLFETYLNENVGILYNPKISFHLVPFDFTESNRAKDIVNAGLVDFVCE